MQKILNLGCGTNPLRNNQYYEFINVDVHQAKLKNYIRHNLRKFPYPFVSGNFDAVYFFHTIEHIPEEFHMQIFLEIFRILKEDGLLYVSYPDFVKCAKNYISNKKGMRDFWKATIYGRGLTEFDRHKALIDTKEFVPSLWKYGFNVVKAYPEKHENYNMVVMAKKDKVRLSYEELLSA